MLAERLEAMLRDPSLGDAQAVFIGTDGRPRPEVSWDAARPLVLLPGAFNPLHAGHLALAALAQRLENKQAAFELSVANVDKPELTVSEASIRLGQFMGQFPVWLTRAARFVDKAALFPGATFVVGADTAARLVAPRYYHDNEQLVLGALAGIREQGCRFLVAGRSDGSGRFLSLEDIAIPPAQRGLFRAIPPGAFRMDISSTSLREKAAFPG